MSEAPKLHVVPSCPDYAVTECGRVFRVTKGRSGYPWPFELKPNAGARGYLTVGINRKTTPIHVLMAEVFLPADPHRPEVAHNDGNRHNNHKDNLRRATRRENNNDRFRHGTVLRGQRVPSHKLTPAEVQRIRRLRHERGLFHREIAEMFSVSRRAVGKILNKETWSHV